MLRLIDDDGDLTAVLVCGVDGCDRRIDGTLGARLEWSDAVGLMEVAEADGWELVCRADGRLDCRCPDCIDEGVSP